MAFGRFREERIGKLEEKLARMERIIIEVKEKLEEGRKREVERDQKILETFKNLQRTVQRVEEKIIVKKESEERGQGIAILVDGDYFTKGDGRHYEFPAKEIIERIPTILGGPIITARFFVGEINPLFAMKLKRYGFRIEVCPPLRLLRGNTTDATVLEAIKEDIIPNKEISKVVLITSDIHFLEAVNLLTKNGITPYLVTLNRQSRFLQDGAGIIKISLPPLSSHKVTVEENPFIALVISAREKRWLSLNEADTVFFLLVLYFLRKLVPSIEEKHHHSRLSFIDIKEMIWREIKGLKNWIESHHPSFQEFNDLHVKLALDAIRRVELEEGKEETLIQQKTLEGINYYLINPHSKLYRNTENFLEAIERRYIKGIEKV